MFKVCSGWELETERGPDWLIVKVNKHSAEEEVTAACPSPTCCGRSWSSILPIGSCWSWTRLSDLDDPLVEQLVQLHDRIAEHGGLMRLCGLSAENRLTLLAGRLDGALVAYVDREDAVSGGGLPRHPR